jgi:hypothetical protein
MTENNELMGRWACKYNVLRDLLAMDGPFMI